MFKRIDSFMVEHFNIHPIDVHKVFTPSICATHNYITRSKLEEQLNNNFLIPGMQIIMYGHSGSGKTTIIRSYLSRNKIHYITTKCDTSTKYQDIIYDGFDKLNAFVTSDRTISHSKQWTSSLRGEYKGIKAQFSKTSNSSQSEKQVRLIPPQLTTTRLAEMMGASGLVWVIEDFHKVDFSEKIHIADMLKVFVDIANEFPQTKTICIGACDSAHELIELDSNIKNRVAQIHIPMLSKEELSLIVENGSRLLNIKMEDSLYQKIVYYSARIASFTHNMCLDICLHNNVSSRQKHLKVIPDIDFKIAVQRFMERNSDTLKTIYDSAVANELGWYILKTFSSNSHEKLSVHEIENRINMSKRQFSRAEINEKLLELSSDQYKVLYYHKTSDLYSISNPFWKQFLRMQFALEQSEQYNSEKEKSNKSLRLINQNDSDAMVEKLFLELLDRLKAIQYPNR